MKKAGEERAQAEREERGKSLSDLTDFTRLQETQNIVVLKMWNLLEYAGTLLV